jgi:hypothetical protein
MSYKAVITAATLCVVAYPVSAQVTGGSLGFTYSLPTDGGDLGGTSYYGAMEYAITRDFSIAGDLSGYRLDNINTDASSVTLHGIYHVDDMVSVGAFYGVDNLGGSEANLYGIEAGTELYGAQVEGFLGRVDASDGDANILGVDATYGIANGFSVTGNAGISREDDNNISRYALGTQYDLADGPQFFAEVGTVSAESNGVTTENTFIGVGARIAIGTQRGTTFDPRSLFEILPGF